MSQVTGGVIVHSLSFMKVKFCFANLYSPGPCSSEHCFTDSLFSTCMAYACLGFICENYCNNMSLTYLCLFFFGPSSSAQRSRNPSQAHKLNWLGHVCSVALLTGALGQECWALWWGGSNSGLHSCQTVSWTPHTWPCPFLHFNT